MKKSHTKRNLIILAFTVLIALSTFFYINPVKGDSFLTQNITSEIRTFVLLVSNHTSYTYNGESIEFTDEMNTLFYDNESLNIDTFFYNYSSLRIALYTDVIPNNNFDSDSTFPFNAIKYYQNTLNETQKQIVRSCNILYTLFSSEASISNVNPNCYRATAEPFFKNDRNERKFILAHEMCHWFGATDKYSASNYVSDNYEAGNPENNYEIMSVNHLKWDSELKLGTRTISEIKNRTSNWSKIANIYVDPYFRSLNVWSLDVISKIPDTTERWEDLI